MKPENVTHAFVGAFVDELARFGIRHACVCPGSRSTPLAMLLDRHPAIKVWMHLDERSAAFFALGLARQRLEAVALLCTSGTAAANFLPAVVEAHYASVPLLVLTADRPPELRDVGAPQAIDQIRLYGNHVKWFVDVSLPEAGQEAQRYIRTLASRAAATALAAPAGPVHLNLPFREPLIPSPADEDSSVQVRGTGRQAGWGMDTAVEPENNGHTPSRPSIRVSDAAHVPDPSTIDALASDLSGMKRGLIVCGPQDDQDFPEAVADLARSLGYPILADPLSQVRCGPHVDSPVIDAYDAFLRDAGCVEALAPEIILRFGAMPTSKPALLYLQRYRGCRQILVSTSPLSGYSGWSDPAYGATDVVSAEPARFCRALTARIGQQAPACQAGACKEWQDRWVRIGQTTRSAIASYLSRLDEPFEGKVFAELAEILPAGAILYAGNSMPVRDLDTFFPRTGRTIRFLANRGANGIDGVISSALGAAAASSEPLVLVIGDLSFYHDLNGLLAAKLHGIDITIVLLNNDGGGIFSFLPQANHPEQFETLFGTPHGLDFGLAVEMYGGSFERVTTWPQFRRALGSLGQKGLRVVEVPTERQRNVTLHREVWAAVSEAVAPLISPVPQPHRSGIDR